MSKFLLEVVTPDKAVVKEEVEMVICPGTEGEFGLLPHHVSLLAALRIGTLRYKKDDQEQSVFVSGGFVDMNNNVCSVLVESAEKAGDIDEARARAAKERAEARLQAQDEYLDEVRAELALKRAIARLQLASGR